MKYSDLPKDLLPFAPRRVITQFSESYSEPVDLRSSPPTADPPKTWWDSLTKSQRIEHCKRLTCRRAYHFICSAYVECLTEILIYADDLHQAERWARDNGWSTISDVGWCCKPCAREFNSSRNGVGPRKKTRKYREALSAKDQAKRRLTLQEFWQIRLEQEHRGNDLAEQR